MHFANRAGKDQAKLCLDGGSPGELNLRILMRIRDLKNIKRKGLRKCALIWHEYNSADYLGSLVGGCVAGFSAQPQLGIWSDRGFGHGLDCSVDLDPDGLDLIPEWAGKMAV